ncbi:MAG: hypothetical protein HOH33_11595 [Verrucomicrobia bacterium]|jgi:hypothetical protein|nr:hypothetical protein [Verrucomicrobiota bacterium]
MPEEQKDPFPLPLDGKTIFVGPQDIACFASRIAEGLAEGGAKVLLYRQVVEPFHPVLDYHSNVDVLFDTEIKKASKALAKNSLKKWIAKLKLSMLKLGAFLTALFQSDACIFIGGRGFIGYPLDYWFLRMFGKKVIHIYIGTASRPRYLSGFAREVLKTNQPPIKEIKKLTKRVKRQSARVKAISRYASLVIENPLCGHFHPKAFINYFQMGIPVGAYFDQSPKAPANNNPKDPTRIFHCPSAPEVKGTHAIDEAIENLRAKGHSLDYIKRTGIPHPEVLKEISNSDFVIDQLYSDAPLAGFATEAIALGKNAIVGGYGWSLLKESLPDHLFPANATCHPSQIEEQILKLMDSPEKSQQMAEKAKNFLNQEWSGLAFSRRVSMLLNDSIPEDWWIAPNQVSYLHGMGLAEDEVRSILNWMIELEGESSLCLDHHPALKQSMLSFAQGG